MSRMSRMSQGSGVGIFGQKYKNHVTGTRNTRMSHLSLLCPIMSRIYCIHMTHQLAALNIALIIALHRTNSALLCASLNVTLHTHYYPLVGCPVMGFKKHCKGKMCKF